MKHYNLLTYIVLFALLFTACKKDDEPIDPSTVDKVTAEGNGGDSGTELKVLLQGFDNIEGNFRVALYSSEANFDAESDPFLGHTAPITSENMEVSFPDVPAGVYAIAMFHDKNQDGELNTNFLNIPTEGFGFSNNPGLGFSKPSFGDVSFEVSGNQDTQIAIELIYI